MNALDLYKHWETFCRMMEDPAFDTQVKHQMGVEMINSLPPAMLCSVGKSSREAIELAMKGRLTDNGTQHGRRSTSKEEEPTSTSPTEEKDGGNRSRKKPLHKNAANGRGA